MSPEDLAADQSPKLRLGLAFSGGLDSSVLLDICTAMDLPVQWVAMHVHHNLQGQAESWLKHCQNQCRRLAGQGRSLSFDFRRLRGQPAPGESLEAWARRGRYEALADMARANDCQAVLLAHHLDDQMETFLLQALRGGGMAGLAGMPEAIHRSEVLYLRPWLKQPRQALKQYADAHQLSFVEDPSNADRRWARNRLRLDVVPALLKAFPDARTTLSQAARWALQAQEGLGELACLDAQALWPQGEPSKRLPLPQWLNWSEGRRAALIRHWLEHLGLPVQASHLSRWTQEWPQAQTGAVWPHPQGEFKKQKDAIVWRDGQTALREASGPELSLPIDRIGTYRIAQWGGTLVVRQVDSMGVPLAWLGQAQIRARQGGERFSLGPGRPARSLKKQFQSVGVDDSARAGPLVYSGGLLIWVPGLGVDARYWGAPGEAMVDCLWLWDEDSGDLSADVD